MAKIILNKNSKGVEIVRTNTETHSTVKVKSGRHILKTYEFLNVPDYESKYMSWKNLDFCGGWATEGNEAQIEAVRNGTKPTCLINIITETPDYKELEKETKKYNLPENYGFIITAHWNVYGNKENWVLLLAPDEMKLSDFYNLDEIRKAYERQAIQFSDDEWEDVEYLANHNIVELPFLFNITDPATLDELVALGMLYGYPIESTASLF